MITKSSLTPWDYVILFGCLSISAGIGVFYRFVGGRQSTTEEYLMADRQMPVFPVALSLLASFISAITLLGTPSEIFLNGTQYALLAFANLFVIPIAAYVYVPILYPLRLTSAYEYLELRFNKGTRTLSTCIFATMMTMYLAIVLYSPCLALSSLTDINLWMIIGIVGAICVFYTTLGGMKAVMWTDAFQVCIMYLGILLVLFLGSSKQEGGFKGAWLRAQSRGRIEFDNFNPNPFERHSFWSVLIGGCFTWLAIYGVNQAQIQRCLSSPSLGQAQLALWINAPGLFLFVVLTSCVGVVVFGRYADCDPIAANIITAKDQLLPLYVMEALSDYSGLVGLFISCVFCGSLSTISSGLNSLSAVVLQDIVLIYIRPSLSDAGATRLSKCFVFCFGALVMALTWVASRMGGVLSAALALFGAIGGPLLGVFSLGIFVPFANSIGAISGLVGGLILSLWITIGGQIYKPPTTLFCKSTMNCSSFSSSISFNASLIQKFTCDRTRIPFEERDHDYQGLAIYRISYLWYSLLSVIVVVSVGIIVSLLSGRSRWGTPAEKLVCPLVRRFAVKEEKVNAQQDERSGGTGPDQLEQPQQQLQQQQQKKEKSVILDINGNRNVIANSNCGYENDIFEPDLEMGNNDDAITKL